MFTKDKTVVPKESAWFGSEAIDNEDESYPQAESQKVLGRTIIPMRLQPLYKEDWIGLRKLDERGGVVLEACVGEHMQTGDCWRELVEKYAGGSVRDS